MKILGLHITGNQSAAALLVNGEIKFAATEERFNRIKQSRDFPKNAIQFCLSEAKLKNIEDLDGIAVSWNPAQNMRNINLSGFTEWRRYDPEWLYIMPNNLMALAGKNAFRGYFLKMDLSGEGKCPIYYVDHHISHLSQAIFQSSFRKGMVAVIDEYGEFYSVTIAKFKGNKFKIMTQMPYPNSLGIFYAALTEYLGFTPNADEWKVMGASAYGNPKKYSDKLGQIIVWDKIKSQLMLDSRLIEHSNMKRAGYLNEVIVDFLGIPIRKKTEELNQEYFDLAAATQEIFEKRLFQLLNVYAKQTGETNLVVAGGCFMNSVANGKIIKSTPFKKIFIPYAAADNGAAMGAALYVWHCINNNQNKAKQAPSPYLGPEYSDVQIEDALRKFKINYKKTDDVAKFTARQLANGKIVGWFQGRMEFGERALGNRSILADPRDLKMKARINLAVKFRENFRPFAPSVIKEKVSQYFEIPKYCNVPYMEQVYPVKKEKANLIPAVVHVDGTSRLHMVSKEMNPLFYQLLVEFEKITDLPVLLNTSFNLQGEPIVCSLQDAIRTFFTSGLNMLIIGNYAIFKKL